ncbi:MAG: helix-turn-helix transcriptional regulator [Paracoccaceae bacterium]
MNKQMTSSPNTSIESSDVYKHVGRQLRAQRIGRGMTQAQVARLIDISPQQYQKYEESQSKCSLTSLTILAEHYGVPLSSFFPEEPEQKPTINEADLLARLVASFSQLDDNIEKLRIVQLIEAMLAARRTK